MPFEMRLDSRLQRSHVCYNVLGYEMLCHVAYQRSSYSLKVGMHLAMRHIVFKGNFA